MERIFASVLACIVGSAAPAANGQAAGAPAPAGPGLVEIPGVMELSGRLIAKPLQDGVLRAGALAALAPFRERWHEPLVDHHVIDVPQGRTERDVIAGLMATGFFEFVEPDWTVYPQECPDDPLLADQWHHDADHMDSCEAWTLHAGDADISVGICDSGVELSHPDLLLRRLEGYNAVDKLWENQGGRISPVHPHGTQTTGCAAANGGNGVGVAGAAPGISHRMLRVSNSPSGASNVSTLTHAALTSIGAGDRVASVSYSGVNNGAIRSTAAQIRAMGGLLVWSAGNNGVNLNWGDRDADDLIVVGATTIDDVKAEFSAFGRSVDLLAPGQDVFTTTTGRTYTHATGTSFATPLAAGLAALIWSKNPALTADEVEQALKLGCDDLGPAGPDDTHGYGRIDALGSLLLAGDPPVRFEYPDGRPEQVDPRGGDAVRLTISTEGVELDGVPKLLYDDGRGYNIVDLVHTGGDEYQIVFPALDCGSALRYYVAALTADGELTHSPPGAPEQSWRALAVSGVETVADYAFEFANAWKADPNDTASAGRWGIMDPEPTAAQPGDDVSPSGTRCWVTDGRAGGALGEFDVDGGATTLLSPWFDLATIPLPVVSYWRWYSNDKGADPQNDTFRVEISDNGARWIVVDTVGPAGPEARGGWVHHEFRVDEFVSLSSRVRLRFVAEDAGEGSVIEAAIDDFVLSSYACEPECAADFNGDKAIDTQDVVAFLNAWTAGEVGADLDGDGAVNTQDMLLFLNFWSGGC